jgi:short-subunit dehydrogenase
MPLLRRLLTRNRRVSSLEFRQRYGPWAIVAGASEGLGEAFSRGLAARGLDLVLIARRAEPLEQLARDLTREHGVEVRTLVLDLGSADIVESLQAELGTLDVGLLVYNAGRSDIGEFLETDLESKLGTIDVNCRGPVLLCSWLAPRLVERGRGGLLLMSSLSAFQGTAMVGTYAATKAFDIIFAESLWTELTPKGVDVLVCVAGAMLTPNFKRQTPEAKRGQSLPMEPTTVAEEALAGLGGGPTVIAGAMNRGVHLVMNRLLPRRTAVKFISDRTRDMYEGDSR